MSKYAPEIALSPKGDYKAGLWQIVPATSSNAFRTLFSRINCHAMTWRAISARLWYKETASSDILSSYKDAPSSPISLEGTSHRGDLIARARDVLRGSAEHEPPEAGPSSRSRFIFADAVSSLTPLAALRGPAVSHLNSSRRVLTSLNLKPLALYQLSTSQRGLTSLKPIALSRFDISRRVITSKMRTSSYEYHEARVIPNRPFEDAHFKLPE